MTASVQDSTLPTTFQDEVSTGAHTLPDVPLQDFSFMSSSQQQYTTAFIDTQDALGSLASSEFAIDGFSMSDYAAASSSFMAPSSGALVPVSVPALNSYTVPGQLQTTDWPLRLPDRQTTRHL